MRTSFRNHRAQSIGEYAVTIAVIVGVLTAMTIFVRRVLQARIHDAEQTMLQGVDTASRSASGGSIGIPGEYEPYYGSSQSDVTQDVNEEVHLSAGGTTGEFHKTMNAEVSSHTKSTQLPPSQAR